MYRMLVSASLAVLVTSAILLVSPAPPNVEADDQRGFSERDIRGDYSVSFDGEITEGDVVGHVASVGRVRSNGRGRFEFDRMLNVNGMAILPQSGTCSYVVRADGRGTADCVVSTAGLPDTGETFAFVIVDRTEVDFISTTPGAVVLGVGKKQRGGSDRD